MPRLTIGLTVVLNSGGTQFLSVTNVIRFVSVEMPTNRRPAELSRELRAECTHRGWGKLVHEASSSQHALPSLLCTYCLVRSRALGDGVEFVPRNMDSFTPLSPGCVAGAECSRGGGARLGHHVRRLSG